MELGMHTDFFLIERGTSRERMEEFEEAVIALECYMASVQKEVEEKTQLVTLLEQAEIFYETERGEAKLVANVSDIWYLPVQIVTNQEVKVFHEDRQVIDLFSFLVFSLSFSLTLL